MYVPNSFAINDPEQCIAFLNEYPFVTLITAVRGEMFASHVPLLVERRKDDQWVLGGHVAKANSHWHAFDGANEALAIFHGPHAYVSPSWYPTQPAVPTWNYAAVHVYGRPRVIEDATLTSRLLDDLLQRFESGPAEKLADDFRRPLESAIVAFEMPIERWQAKFKLNQNRSAADRAAVVEHLSASKRADEQAMAEFMRRHETRPA